MKKKILFMLTSMNIGGVEKSFLSLLSTFSKDKYEVTLLLLEKKGGFLECVPDWVRIEEAYWYKDIKPIIMQPPQKTVKHFLYHKKIGKMLAFIYSYLISKYLSNRYFYYKSVMRDTPYYREKYDIAVAYQGPTDIIDFYIADKVTANRKITWVHFDVSKHKVNERLYAKLYRSFGTIYTVSELARKNLEKSIPHINNKCKVFKNVVQKDLIKSMANVTVDFDEDYKGVKIVTVGRLSWEKGQDRAIKVLAKLRTEGYEVRWYCVGEGNARPEYERLISEYEIHEDFLLLGEKTNPFPYILRSDIYVQPSRHEGYCLTLAEAKCLLKPIVTTNFLGAFEQIEDDYNGYIVKGDIDEIYIRIKSLIDNQTQREKFELNLGAQQSDTKERFNKLIDNAI